MGHILENAPNNVASVLRGPAHGNFMLQPEQQVTHSYPAITDSDHYDDSQGSVSWPQLEEASSSALFPTWDHWSFIQPFEVGSRDDNVSLRIY